MPTIKELRLRIKSLQSTSKITSAMKMVSAARLRRAQDAFNRNKPYAEKMQELLEQVTASFQDLDHPLMKVRERKRVRYIVVASDRGLCGSFNNNLLKFFARGMDAAKANEALGLGRRAKDYVARNRLAAKASEALGSNVPTYANALEIARNAIRDFISGDVDAVYLVYNRYNSVLSQTPIQLQMLPFTAPASQASPAKKERAAHGETHGGYRLDYIVEPNPAEVFAELLPKLVTIQVLRALLENAVGEHTARMTAMDAATKNTKELIGSLTLKMNRARQAAITKELIEIVSGAEALNG
ncbi:MAG TPA: ATP synthase F1 subunit gamma [Fibrobacteria bacterium]|nr:ATP synthase F1 subunit gamma [Fibrobacteria bacterium]